MQVKNRLRWGFALTILVGLNACTNNDIDPNAGTTTVVPTKGSADFTKYVAVGNSLTAGYADGGLYRDSQLNSYPSILAGQFTTVGGGSFVQPLFTEAQAAGAGYLKLIRVPSLADPTSLITSIAQVAPGAARGGTTANGSPLLTKFTDANQNLGVPSIRVSDILTSNYGLGNPYFERLVANPAATTYFQYMSDNLNGATFFSCWLGNNDALGYATNGGTVPLTPIELFTTNFTAAMNKLTEGGRKGVVIGIPNITTTPYFATLTVPLAVAQINLALNNPTPAITALVIQTAQGVRATKTGDLLMIPNALEYAKIGSTAVGTKAGSYGLSATNPLPTQYVLDADEVTALNAAITAYDGVMKAQADAKGVAYVDPNTVLNQAATAGGISQGGITYTSSFIQGGVFSLDGIHLTPAGYALMANEIIKGINAKYSATIPQVNPANYRRVLLQQ